MIRYYLGVKVIASHVEPDGWCWAEWPDGRRFRHWHDQLEVTPWGE